MKKTFKRIVIVIVIALSALLLIGHTFAQPIIAIGSSRGFIRHNMAKDTLFSLACASKYSLQYKCPQTGVTVLYRFITNDPDKSSQTCMDMVVNFPSEISMQEYLDGKLTSCKLIPKPDNLSYQLVTDLFDEPLCFITVGTKRLIIKYCER